MMEFLELMKGRAILWLTAPLACKFGRHSEPSVSEIGYDFGGMLDFYCSNCQKRIASKSVDSLTAEEYAAYTDLMADVREVQRQFGAG